MDNKPFSHKFAFTLQLFTEHAYVFMWETDYLFMTWFKLIHISKGAHGAKCTVLIWFNHAWGIKIRYWHLVYWIFAGTQGWNTDIVQVISNHSAEFNLTTVLHESYCATDMQHYEHYTDYSCDRESFAIDRPVFQQLKRTYYACAGQSSQYSRLGSWLFVHQWLLPS